MNQEMRHPKYSVPVRISMSDATQIIGVLFVRQNQRILDVLCDERTFFPIETTTGIKLLNKHHAILIDVVPMQEILDRRDLFPEVDLNYLKNNGW